MRMSQEGKKLRELISETEKELSVIKARREQLAREIAIEDAESAIHDRELKNLRACLSSPVAKPANEAQSADGVKPKGGRKPRKNPVEKEPDNPPQEGA